MSINMVDNGDFTFSKEISTGENPDAEEAEWHIPQR